MNRRKLKPFVIPSIYSLIVVFVVMSLFFLQRAANETSPSEKDQNFDYVIKTLFGDVLPVVGDKKVIVRPYNSKDVSIVKHYYDENATADKQEKSIIYHEKTYIQNSGVDYGGTNNFDVVAILDGTVINVKEDNLLGKTIEIRHTNDFISVYQCLSELNVKKDDNVIQGELIGKSGICNIASDLGDHLHFEILYKGQVKNPEMFYDKTIKDL
ncbi:MAG: M23 family metallopeptidase [Bacilli bacterium]|nr:M23 family metallopeptidase [Bacilli bacterium]